MGRHGKQQKRNGPERGAKTKAQRPRGVGRVYIGIDELEAILDRVRASLTEDEYAKIHGALKTLLFLTRELEKKRVSVQRLKAMLFGAATEKTKDVLEKILEASGAGNPGSTPSHATKPHRSAGGHELICLPALIQQVVRRAPPRSAVGLVASEPRLKRKLPATGRLRCSDLRPSSASLSLRNVRGPSFGLLW